VHHYALSWFQNYLCNFNIDWLRKARHHIEEIEALLIANHHLTRVQLDAMWAYVGHKGEKATILKNQIKEHSGEAQL